MNTKMRKVKFWGKNSLQCIAMAAGAALAVYLINGVGSSEYSGDTEAVFMELMALYPYYLLVVGAGLTMIICFSYFQTYFSILVSMNATRKSVVGEILASIAVMGIILLLISALIWKMTPGETAQLGWKLLPLFTGLFFGMTAYFIIFNVVLSKWRRRGVMLMLLAKIVIAVIIGFGAAANGSIVEMQFLSLSGVAGRNFQPVMILGIVLYLIAGFFAAAAMRKLEVRM